MGNPALFSGSFVKFLKSSLNLADKAYITPGTADPSSTATSAPASSLYLRATQTTTTYAVAPSGSGSFPSNPGKRATVFTATMTGIVTSCLLNAQTAGGASGNVFAKIYSTVAGVPSVAIATSNSVAAASLPVFDSITLTSFTFPSPPTLVSGTQYALVYDFSGALPGNPSSVTGLGFGQVTAGYTTFTNGGGAGDSFSSLPGNGPTFTLVTASSDDGGVVFVKQDAGLSTNWSPLATRASTLYAATKAPADGFSALISDRLDTTSKLDTTLTQGTYSRATNSSGMYSLVADKGKLVTTVGTAYTLSAGPSFTVTPGCIIYFNGAGVFRRIVTVTSQTVGVLDAALPSNVTSVTCMVSQAVWTSDLVNIGDAGQATRLRDFFPSTSNNTIHLEYYDSSASADTTPDFTSTALMVGSVSNSGLQSDTGAPLTSTFAPILIRPAAPAQINDYPLIANANQQRLFAVFFPNPNISPGSGSSTTNLLGYDLSAYIKTTTANGGTLNSSYVQSDGTGTAVNSGTPTFTGGNTRIVLGYNFIPGVNPGMPDGDLEVLVEGLVIPRFFTGVVGSYYTEVAGTTNTIDISGDLTILSPSVSIHTRRRQGQTDGSTANAYKLASYYDAVVGSAAQVTTGAAGYTTIAAAIAAAPQGRILVLAGTYTENITTVATTNDQLFIQGQGHKTLLTGNLTMGGSFTDIGGLKVTGAISITGNANFLKTWLATAGSFANTGTGNSYQVIQE